MILHTADVPRWLQWGVAERALELQSGDDSLVQAFAEGILLAVVDGLGHGAEARVAAQTAVATLAEHAGESLIALVERCHENLRRTRGVVLSLARLDPRTETLTWLGVGDVDGLLLRTYGWTNREALIPRGGVVGYQLPPLRAADIPLWPGDTLILSTDGIRNDFAEMVSSGDPPQQIADRILAERRRGSDDALVLVARYMGCAP